MELKVLNKEEFTEALPRIDSLFKTSFEQKVHQYFDQAYLKWRFLDNPSGDLIVSVAIDKGKYVAVITGSAAVMHINNKAEKVYLHASSATDPTYRELGLFSTLVRNQNNHFQEKGYKLVYAFPNHYSHLAIATKMNDFVDDVYEIPTMELEVAKAKEFAAVSADPDHRFALNYDRFTEPGALNCVQKDQRYLQWRYRDHPLNSYENFVLQKQGKVSAFSVVKKYQDRLNVIDLQANDPEEGKYLVQNAINYARSLNLAAVTIWAPLHTYLHIICAKYGFRNNAPITYLIMAILGDGPSDISTNYFKWYFQLGDNNAY